MKTQTKINMKWREELLKLIKKKVKKDNTGHDINHLIRTEKNALRIAKDEKNIDKEVLSAAALIHDVGRIDEFKGIDHVETGVKLAKKWLPQIKFPKEKIVKVVEAVKLHEQRPHHENKKSVQYKETLIIQDADNLDFLGALGIARGFQFASAHNIPVYNPKYKFEKSSSYKPLKKVESEIHLINFMPNQKFNTKCAKKLAKPRIKFIKSFVDEFIKEWEGKL